MNNPKKIKLYGILLGVACGVLVWDQIFPVEEAEANGKSEFAVKPDDNSEMVDVVIPTTQMISLEHTFAHQLERVADQRQVARYGQINAFKLPVEWGINSNKPEVNLQNPKVDQPKIDLAEDFRKKYRLTGVLSQQDEGIAVINGNKILHVGKVLDGFRLVSVTDRQAVFVRGEWIAELKLQKVSSSGKK